MKVFVTGATGYIGTAITEALAKRGHEVLALARSDAAERRLTALGYAARRGDVRDAKRVAAIAAEADAVIHAANTGDAGNAAADAEATLAILGALEGTGKTLVYTSGAWVLGDTGERIADETARTNSIPLTAWRGPLEERVLEASRHGVRTVVLRPAIAYGRAGGIPGMLASEARKTGAVRVVGDGRQEWPVVHVDDLADLYVRALDAPAGAILHGATGTSYRVRDLAVAASLGAGAGGRVVEWPRADAVRELGGFGEALALHQRVSSVATQRTLGWAPRGPSPIEELLVGSYAATAATSD